MSDRTRIARKLLARIRELKGDIVWDDVGNRLFIAGRWKLPTEACVMIKYYGRELAQIVQEEAGIAKQDEIEERAAKIEFSGGAPRTMAEQFARICCAEKPSNWSAEDHAWFISRCAKIIDEAADIKADSRRAA